MDLALLSVAFLSILTFVRVEFLLYRLRKLQKSLDDVADSASDHVRG